MPEDHFLCRETTAASAPSIASLPSSGASSEAVGAAQGHPSHCECCGGTKNDENNLQKVHEYWECPDEDEFQVWLESERHRLDAIPFPATMSTAERKKGLHLIFHMAREAEKKREQFANERLKSLDEREIAPVLANFATCDNSGVAVVDADDTGDDHYTAPRPYLPGGQKKLIATRDFAAFEPIVLEYPLLRVSFDERCRDVDAPQHVGAPARAPWQKDPGLAPKLLRQFRDELSGEQQAVVLALHKQDSESSTTWPAEWDELGRTLVEIFRSNSICGGRARELHALISRANHSCRPNAVLYDEPFGVARSGPGRVPGRASVLVAMGAIRAGEEVTWNYDAGNRGGESWLFAAAHIRREYVRARWDFLCCCVACENRKKSDSRRRVLLDTYSELFWLLTKYPFGHTLTYREVLDFDARAVLASDPAKRECLHFRYRANCLQQAKPLVRDRLASQAQDDREKFLQSVEMMPPLPPDEDVARSTIALSKCKKTARRAQKLVQEMFDALAAEGGNGLLDMSLRIQLRTWVATCYEAYGKQDLVVKHFEQAYKLACFMGHRQSREQLRTALLSEYSELRSLQMEKENRKNRA